MVPANFAPWPHSPLAEESGFGWYTTEEIHLAHPALSPRFGSGTDSLSSRDGSRSPALRGQPPPAPHYFDEEDRGRACSRSAPDLHEWAEPMQTAAKRLTENTHVMQPSHSMLFGGNAKAAALSKGAGPPVPNVHSCMSSRTFNIDTRDSAVMSCLLRKANECCDGGKISQFSIGSSTARRDVMDVQQAMSDGMAVSPVTFTLHVPEFRVQLMPNSLGMRQYAEFKVVLQAGQLRWVQWKRFSQFRLLFQALDEGRFRAALKAWRAIKRIQKPWRCLELRYLGRKCRLLEAFTQQVMWESGTALLLLKFLNETSP